MGKNSIGKKCAGRGRKRAVGKSSCSLRAETDDAYSLFAGSRYLPPALTPLCSRVVCMPLWHNNVHCTSEQCYPSVSLYNRLLSPRIAVVPRLIARRALIPFFSNRAFWGNKRHRDWQLRRVRIARVISNKHHKIEKLMSYP